MSKEVQHEDIKQLADELIDKLTAFANRQNGKNTTTITGDIILEDEPGKFIKMDNKIFYQVIYTDVKQLKKDSETLINQYLDEIKPTLKSVDENVIELGKNFKSVKVDVDELKENKPKSFGKWISEKGKLAENTTNIFKFIFFFLAILWILSTGLPAMIKFLAAFAGVDTGG